VEFRLISCLAASGEYEGFLVGYRRQLVDQIQQHLIVIPKEIPEPKPIKSKSESPFGSTSEGALTSASRVLANTEASFSVFLW
jgi:hypothetical protein